MNPACRAGLTCSTCAWNAPVTPAVTGQAPMLTPGKVRELRQSRWLCDNRAFTLATGWAPQIDLASGAARLFQPPTENDTT